RNHGSDPPITVLNRALWPVSTSLRITSDGEASRVSPHGSLVQTITPPELIQLSGGTIDVLKLDIEGAELELFADTTAPEWLRHVRVLIVETHDHLAPGSTLLIGQRLRETGWQWACRTHGECPV